MYGLDPDLIRLLSFISIFALIALVEYRIPCRQPTVSKKGRWFNNLSIIFLDSLLIRILFPSAAVAVAAAAQQHDWGLFNLYQLSPPFSLLLSLLILDLIIYLQHLMFHAVPALWRLHMVHHADLDFDLTTGLRFHPLEIILSMLIKIGAVAALGPPPGAVLAFEVILNGTALFNHGNLALPKQLDTLLRLFVVTPDMHRVHHSVIIRETNSNFGFNFPWWDRLLGTYRARPAAGQRGMTIGLSQFRTPEQVTLPRLLLLPFIGAPGYYSLRHTGNKVRKIKK